MEPPTRLNSQCLALSQNYQICKEENIAHNEGETSIETDPEMAQMIELVDKTIKIISITIFHVFKKQQERLSILRGGIKRTQILEMKTKIPDTEKEQDPEFSWELPSWMGTSLRIGHRFFLGIFQTVKRISPSLEAGDCKVQQQPGVMFSAHRRSQCAAGCNEANPERDNTVLAAFNT